MPICNEKKLVFVHIPKNAGSSINRALGISYTRQNMMGVSKDRYKGNDEVLQHFTYDEIMSMMPHPDIDKYKSFAVVRNPYDRLVSEYHWQWEGMGLTFKEFLKVAKGLKDNLRHLWPQHYFICDFNDQVQVDHEIRFEYLQTGFNALLDEYIELPHDKPTEYKKPFMEYYDEEDKEIVREMYAKDFKIFGYEP